jgi:uncharacterized protein (TIGR04255 family)
MGKYSRPPIVEAVIDISSASKCNFSDDLVDTFHNEIKENFPKKQPQITPNISVNIDRAKGASFKIDDKSKAYRFISNDDTYILQLIENRFIFSSLKQPYLGWELFIKEFEKSWIPYSRIYNPMTINRIGLRYINRFLCKDDELNKLLNIKQMISFPEKMNFGITNALQRFHVFEIDKKEYGIINLLINPQQNMIEAIFDIDAYEMENIDVTWDSIIIKLESLRKFKNEIFEANITDQARRSFQ